MYMYIHIYIKRRPHRCGALTFNFVLTRTDLGAQHVGTQTVA